MFDYGAALSYLIITADTSAEVLRRILGFHFTGMVRRWCGGSQGSCSLPTPTTQNNPSLTP